MPQRGAQLSAKLKADMAAIQAAVSKASNKPKVLFVMGQGPAGLQAAGTDTPADTMINMAMAQNIATFDGFKPFTREAAAALAPDVILVADFSVQALGGVETTRARPEFMLTPAGRNNRVYLADTMMVIGFGPRTAEGLAWLAKRCIPISTFRRSPPRHDSRRGDARFTHERRDPLAQRRVMIISRFVRRAADRVDHRAR